MTRVDGATLPCCAQSDSSGTLVTIVGGRLTLGDADPEEHVYTPAGSPMARSCVHEASAVAYPPPPCGDGDYTMVITRRHHRADGTSDTISEATSGKYTWGNEPAGGGILSLVGSRGIGQITTSERGVRLAVQMGVRVGPQRPVGPQYECFRATP